MKLVKGGLNFPKGFLSGATRAGLKKKGDDLALIVSKFPAVSDGVFTQNYVEAAPLTVSRDHLRQDIMARAIVVNSGCANACTGPRGIKDAFRITDLVAKQLRVKKEDVLIASTGLIGKYLDMGKITKVIPRLAKGINKKGSLSVAKAIQTTDTFAKEAATDITIGSKVVRICAVAKGAGMVHPNMATMLCFITTDINITRRALKLALEMAVNKSFNSISIDGDTSTNDCALILANGTADNRLIDKNNRGFKPFVQALEFVLQALAKMIVKDGEGSSKFVEIVIKNCPSYWQGLKVGKRIASSTLFKTCVYGEDPNWGRIAAAIGSSGIRIKRDSFDIYLGKRMVVKNGATTGTKREDLKSAFKGKEISITVDLKIGKETVTVWTCDLTEKYIKINAGYST